MDVRSKKKKKVSFLLLQFLNFIFFFNVYIVSQNEEGGCLTAEFLCMKM